MIRALLNQILRVVLPERKTDQHGSGHFGAPRGARRHTGVDYAAFPGTEILSPLPGRVIRRGFCYSDGVGSATDENPFRLVEIQHDNGQVGRYLYIEPLVGAGDRVARFEPIGRVQDLNRRLKNITPHVHVDVKINDKVVAPDQWFKES